MTLTRTSSIKGRSQ